MVTWGFWTLYSTGTLSAAQQILTTSASLTIICGDRYAGAAPLDRLDITPDYGLMLPGRSTPARPICRVFQTDL